jgi:hypothetical protein
MEKLTTKLNLITMKLIIFFFPLWGNNITIRVKNQDTRRWMYFPCEIRSE